MKSILKIIIVAAAFFGVIGCTTNLEMQSAKELKGKRIGVQLISIKNTNLPRKKLTGTDTICTCISQSATEAMYPFLQQAGFVVVPLSVGEKTSIYKSVQVADSLKLDYILSGNGIVEFTGSSPFMHQLTVNAINVKTGAVQFSGSFSGAAVSPVQAAARIGKQIVKKML